MGVLAGALLTVSGGLQWLPWSLELANDTL
jgi:hypothetical protein